MCSFRSRLSASVSRSAARMRSQSPPISSTSPQRRRGRARKSPANRRARGGRPDTARRPPVRRSHRRACATARGSGRGKPATTESIRTPAPSDSGARRASASRTDPSARFAAAAILSGAASLQGVPRLATASTMSSAVSGSSRNRRQRERIVARTWPGRCETMRMRDRCGGSSTIFNNALALLRFRSSAESTIATRQPPKAADS